MTLHEAITKEMVPFDDAGTRIEPLVHAFVTLMGQFLDDEGKSALVLVLKEYKICTGVLAGIREALDEYK